MKELLLIQGLDRLLSTSSHSIIPILYNERQTKLSRYIDNMLDDDCLLLLILKSLYCL